MRRALVLVVVTAGVAFGAGCSGSNNHYGSGTQAAFMETCTVHESQRVPTCVCIYDEITKQVPFDRYVELDKQMQKDQSFVPDELVHITADCASHLSDSSSSASSTSSSSASSSSSDSTSSTSSSLSSSSNS
ncbi:MAG TPA: hypothetical protein VGZ52_02090 [Acidimicrobiales bacterium]|nr:hypothetical protein [Acidimicrobiales bacterium]